MTSRTPEGDGSVALADPTDQPREPANDKIARGSAKIGFDRFSGLYFLAGLIVLFSITQPESFASVDNLRIVATSQAITAIVAVGLVVPVAAGVFDLSVGAMLGFALILVAKLQEAGVNAVLSVLIVLAIGAIVGAVNGFFVTVLHVDSFITTLGVSSVLAAGAYWLSEGQQLVGGFSEGFLRAGQGDLLGIPLPIIYVVVLALAMWFVLEYTPTGRFVYAAGGNPQAARLAGVRVNRIVVGALITSAVFASLGGVVLAARIAVADEGSGPPYLLPVYAAVFLGATQITPGRMNVLGTIVAIYLLATGVTGLQLSGAPVWVESLFNGLALLVAVALAVRSRRKAGTQKLI